MEYQKNFVLLIKRKMKNVINCKLPKGFFQLHYTSYDFTCSKLYLAT